jgi:nifR3 family TIM-barrel protein
MLFAKTEFFCYNVGMKIGNLNLEGLVICAPMAGISTPPYRLFARRFGAAAVYTEMVSSHGLAYNSRKTKELLDFSDAERPLGIQLFGADPEIMHRACQIVSEWNPDIIDLNFGCPVKKVVRKNGGAAVLKDLGLTRTLVEAAVTASDIPVTVKLRSGWDETTRIFAEAGKVCEEAGAAAITLHARTRSKQFSGRACWGDIKKLKETVSVPVIGNGDVTCGEDAARLLSQTGCDAVMVGRAAMGYPWIFREINHYLATGQELPPPNLADRIEIILEHARMLIDNFGEPRAMLKMRHHVAWYAKGWLGVARIRQKAYKMTTYAELEEILNDYRLDMEPDAEADHWPE